MPISIIRYETWRVAVGPLDNLTLSKFSGNNVKVLFILLSLIVC